MGAVAVFLDFAAGIAPPAVEVKGWTNSALVGVAQLVATLGLGGGALKILADYLVNMRKIAQSRADNVDARGDAQNIALAKRVTELETALVAERRDCDTQLREMRRDYDERLREMQAKMDGLMRQMIAFQSSEARAMPLSPQMEKAMEALDRVKGTGE